MINRTAIDYSVALEINYIKNIFQAEWKMAQAHMTLDLYSDYFGRINLPSGEIDTPVTASDLDNSLDAVMKGDSWTLDIDLSRMAIRDTEKVHNSLC